MKKRDVIRKLCELARAVGDHVGSLEATDCFCDSSSSLGNFQFSGRVIEFIERAVLEDIKEGRSLPEGQLMGRSHNRTSLECQVKERHIKERLQKVISQNVKEGHVTEEQ